MKQLINNLLNLVNKKRNIAYMSFRKTSRENNNRKIRYYSSARPSSSMAEENKVKIFLILSYN